MSRFDVDPLGRQIGKVTSLKFVNETDKSLLMSGSSKPPKMQIARSKLTGLQVMVVSGSSRTTIATKNASF